MRLLFLLFFFLLFSCNKNLVPTQTGGNTGQIGTTGTTGTVETGIFYESFLTLQSGYKFFLKTCTFCGGKVLLKNGTYVQRYHTSGKFNCDNWISTPSFFQIKFESETLPSNVSAFFLPRYNDEKGSWGTAIKLSGIANYDNNAKGFEATLEGVPGNQIFVRSSEENHTKNDKISIQILYGQGSNITSVASANLVKQNTSAVSRLGLPTGESCVHPELNFFPFIEKK